MSLEAASDPADPPSDNAIAESHAAWASERAAIRAGIEAALDGAGPHPIARRTLALLIEARLDRAGGEAASPQTLDDLVAQMRSLHPGLFKAPEPEPAAAPEPVQAAAGPAARPWAGPMTKARAALTQSGLRGRALATAAAARLMRVRTRAQESIAAASTRPQPSAEAAGAGTAGGGAGKAARFGAQARRSARRLRYRAAILSARGAGRARQGWDDVRDAAGAGGILRRPSVAVALAGIGLAGLVGLAWRGGGPADEPRSGPAPAATEEPRETVPAPDRPAIQAQAPRPARPVQPPPDDEPAPDDAPMQAETPPQAGGITGKAEVIDTATLKVGGKLVRLFGVLWVRGGQTEELTRYLGGRSVTCQPVAGSDAHLCSVDGRDLSEVVLFNGGGRASPEATPDLVAAEDRAKTERLGVWAR